MKNIACNLIYNNGGEDVFVGFEKRCDIKNIIYNVEKGKGRWCSQPACSCKKYYDKGFKGNVEEYPCNESALFKYWTWTPGSEFKTDKPFKILFTGKGKFAILTTCFPNTTEAERKIVGFIKIKDIIDDHHALISNGGVYMVFELSLSHQVLVYFDSKALRNPPHAHSANR